MQSGHEIQGLSNTYVIEGVVGEGGFGVTYRARTRAGELVAVKVMRLEHLDSWKALELFEREAAVLKSLDHPSIPAYVEFFATTPDGPVEHSADHTTAPEALFLVQRLVEGADLARRMGLGESYSSEVVVKIVRQVLETLAYLHELNPPVVHRDVNPRNIVLDDAGAAYLVDFGAIQQQLQQQTMGGSTLVGSLGFMPIEQSLGKARPASDLYALAVTTVVLMTGLQPEGLPLDEATSKIDIHQLGLFQDADVPRRRLELFLDRALEPIIGQRLSSARSGLGILDGEDQLIEAPNTLPATPQPSWKRTLFTLFLGGSLGGAGIIYPLNFNNFSEHQMIQMAPFWVLPAAFGFIGLQVQHSKNPIRNAALGTVLVGLALAFFFAAIFPTL